MAEHAESTHKKYPFDEEDIKYEKEIVDSIKKLPIDQRFQAIALNNYVLMRKQLDVEVEGQIQEIVKKYNKLQAPFMQALNELIGGKRAPTEEEYEAIKEHLNDEERGKIAESVNSDPIPEYWFKVLTSCAKLKEDIFEADHALLKHITMIEQIPEDEGENFTIRFHFSPNEYFENEHLSVRFVMVDENDVAKTEGTEIKWKEGKDITKKTVTKKQKNKKTGKTRTVTKTVDADSFFTFFKSIDPKDEEGEDDEEAGDEDTQRLGINYDIAVTLQEEIISYHLEYFLGLRTGEEDEDDDLEGIDEEDDEDDDDEEEEGGHKHTKHCSHKAKGGKKEGGADAAAGGQKQECKQQ